MKKKFFQKNIFSESPEKDSDPSFFEILESQKLSRRENPSNYVKIHGIWVEKSYLEAENELESVESSGKFSNLNFWEMQVRSIEKMLTNGEFFVLIDWKCRKIHSFKVFLSRARLHTADF